MSAATGWRIKALEARVGEMERRLKELEDRPAPRGPGRPRKMPSPEDIANGPFQPVKSALTNG